MASNDELLKSKVEGRSNAPAAYGERALQDMPGCAVVFGPRGRIVYANESAQQILGIGPFVGKSFAVFFQDNSNPDNDRFFEVLLSAVYHREQRNQERCHFVASDGKRYTFFVTSSMLSTAEGESYLVITCADVSEEERLEHLRRESTFVFLAAIVYICIVIFCYAFWNYFGQPFPPTDFTIVLEVLGVILGFIVYKKTSLTLADLGLGTNNLAQNLKVDGLASLAIVAFFAVLKLILMNFAPQVITHPEAFFVIGWVGPGRFFAYIATAIIQEFLSRGIMQESLTHVIASDHNEALSIIISTLMFAAMHVHYSPFFMIGAGVLLSIFGIIYAKQRSIWGLALIHFSFGMSAAMLGLI